jgi:hypothetical protein
MARQQLYSSENGGSVWQARSHHSGCERIDRVRIGAHEQNHNPRGNAHDKPRDKEKEQNDQVRQRQYQSQRNADRITFGWWFDDLYESRIRLVAKRGVLIDE